MIIKNSEKNSHTSDLESNNPNHLKFKHQELFFEILGGVNPESYQTLRVMVVVRYNRIAERDHIDLYNNYNLTGFIKKVAEKTGFSFKYIEEGFKELTDELEQYKQQLIEKKSQSKVVTVSLSDDQDREAKAFLIDPDLLQKTNTLIGMSGVLGNENNRLILFLLYLSRMQSTPMHAVVQSNYHYLQSMIGELVPEEDKIFISHLSDNALFYFDKNELSGKLLLVEDTGSNKSKLLPLFDLQTKGVLTKTVTQKDSAGFLKTVQREVRGPISLSLSTPQEQTFTSNTVLSFVITEDESKDQDQRVMVYQRKQSAGLVNSIEQHKVKEQLRNIQRCLQPMKIVNPYAENIMLPEQMLDKQITNLHYLRFIEVITLFKQHQKEQRVDKSSGEVYIETSIEDIEQANDLLSGILLKKCDGLNHQTRTYFEKLKQHLQTLTQKEFTNMELSLALNVPISTVKRHTSTLLSLGHILATGEGTRATGYKYKLNNDKEYQQFQKIVEATLNKSITAIKNQNLESSSSQLTLDQTENELTKNKNTNTLTRVAQNNLGVVATHNSIAI